VHRGQQQHEDLKKLRPPLDIGSHSNAGRQPLGTAGARYERTLFPVGWTPLLSVYLPCISKIG
jgi:hypothetical protein